MSYIVPRSIPKKCIHCDFSKLIASRDDEIECTLERIYVRPYEKYAFCPMVEIHTPHGRLIDADALKSKFRHGEGDSDADSAWISTIRRFITQADTIIERSEK